MARPRSKSNYGVYRTEVPETWEAVSMPVVTEEERAFAEKLYKEKKEKRDEEKQA